MKFSKAERAGLYLTAGALLFLFGWALRGVFGGEDYAISHGPVRQLAPSPTAQVFVPDGPVDINTATAEDLIGLPGIGQTRAQAIVDYRATNGPFLYPEDIMEVPGVGKGVYEQLIGYITTQAP